MRGQIDAKTHVTQALLHTYLLVVWVVVLAVDLCNGSSIGVLQS